MNTQKQIEAIQTIGCMILVSVSEEGAPSGHVYARLCDKINLDQYQTILGHLKERNVLNEDSHYLTRGENYDKTLSLLKKVLGV